MSDTTWDPHAVGIEIRTPEGHFKCRCGASYWNATNIVDVVTCNVCKTAYKLGEPVESSDADPPSVSDLMFALEEQGVELAGVILERDALAREVDRVRKLHVRTTDYDPDLDRGGPGTTIAWCQHCASDGWPCETIRALDGES
jgi:hypothetical protein